MDKIKEKPQATSSIREKITAAPKELVHRGLEDGTDRLRTQLRDAAQQGRRDDYGGDQIEDTAAGGMRRMERGAEKLIKEKRKNRASRDGSSADSTAVDPVPEIRTREHESRVNAAAADQPAEPAGNAGQRIKTKDAYLRAQTETQVSGLSPERTQGQQPFIRERGRQAAQKSAQDRVERMRQPAGSGQEPVQPVGDRRSSGSGPPFRRRGSQGCRHFSERCCQTEGNQRRHRGAGRTVGIHPSQRQLCAFHDIQCTPGFEGGNVQGLFFKREQRREK